MNRSGWTRMAWIVVALAVAVTLFAPSLAETHRLVVRVDEPFRIGDEVYPPGRVVVKSVRSYTPTTLLSEIWVGSRCLGMFRARKLPVEEAQALDTLTFERSPHGRLSLVGFSVAGHPGHGAYRLQPATEADPAELARR